MTSYAYNEKTMLDSILAFKADQKKAVESVRPQRVEVLPQPVREVIAAVATSCSMETSELMRRTNEHRSVRPRQLAMLLVHHLGRYSLSQIAHYFGGYHHTTVLHAIRHARELCSTDQTWQNALIRAKAILGEHAQHRDKVVA